MNNESNLEKIKSHSIRLRACQPRRLIGTHSLVLLLKSYYLPALAPNTQACSQATSCMHIPMGLKGGTLSMPQGRCLYPKIPIWWAREFTESLSVNTVVISKLKQESNFFPNDGFWSVRRGDSVFALIPSFMGSKYWKPTHVPASQTTHDELHDKNI